MGELLVWLENISEHQWVALGVISTTIGAISTFIAVLVALFSNKKANKQTSIQLQQMQKQLHLMQNQNSLAYSALDEAKKQTEEAKQQTQLVNRQVSAELDKIRKEDSERLQQKMSDKKQKDRSDNILIAIVDVLKEISISLSTKNRIQQTIEDEQDENNEQED